MNRTIQHITIRSGKTTQLKLVKALRDLYMQNYGVINHWAGVFKRCEACNYHYSYVGNWKDDESCPQCNAREVLATLGVLNE